MHSLKCDSSVGFDSEEDEEVNALVYLSYEGLATSYLAIAGNSGKIVILDLATMEPCFLELDFIPSEILYLHFRKKSDGSGLGQLVSVNMD